ncbi:MAG: CAP domain-containing protein [Myxococcota bacterium]
MLACLLLLGSYGQFEGDLPSYEEREVLLYTNRLRVDPDAVGFGTYSPVAPLLWELGLAEASRAHAEDMRDNGCFQHDSCDGTSWSARIAGYYGGWGYGENIAAGYSSASEAVNSGWLYSDGHRENMLSGSYVEMGAGFASGGAWGSYWVQDFGGGSGQSAQPVAEGLHLPKEPRGTVTFGFTVDTRAASDVLVETEDDCLEPTLVVGTDTRGYWEADASTGSGCQAYRFVWDGGSYPEDGVFQYGSNCAMWVDEPGSGACGGEGDADTDADTDADADGDTDTDTDADADTDDTGFVDRNGDGLPDDPRERDPLDDGEQAACGCGSGSAAALFLPLLLVPGRRRYSRV